MIDLEAIGVEIVRIDSRCSLDKQFIELIHMNHQTVLYLATYQLMMDIMCQSDNQMYYTLYVSHFIFFEIKYIHYHSCMMVAIKSMSRYSD